MVDLTVSGDMLLVNVRGADKVWALKGSLELRLDHITGVRTDPEIVKGWYHGVRFPGTHLPGVITAGTYYQDGKRVFWDVHNPECAVVIDLCDEMYDRLVVEVADPEEAVALIGSVSGNAST